MSGRNFFDINHEINFTGKINKDYDKFNEKKFKKDKNEEIYGIFYGDIDLENESQNEDDIYIQKSKKGKKESKNKSYKNEISLNQKFITGREKFLNLKNSEINKDSKNSNKNSSIESDDPDEIFNKKKEEKQKKVKITEIRVDDENRIKEEFKKRLTEEKKEKFENEHEEKKTKGELSKDYSKTFGKGFAMLKKIGFNVGKGLGAKEQGMTKPIEIKRREKNKGISHEDIKKGNSEDDYSENEYDNDYHKNKKLHTLKSKKDLLGKKKKQMKEKEDKMQEFDEFEKLAENWHKFRQHVINKEKGKLKNYVEDDENSEIDLEMDIDISKFLLEKTKFNENFIGFNNKQNKSFYDKYNLKKFIRKNKFLNYKNQENDIEDFDKEPELELSEFKGTEFSYLFKEKIKTIFEKNLSKEDKDNYNMKIDDADVQEKDEENKLNYDELNDFIFDFIKENKQKAINYFLEFKQSEDDLFTFEYQNEQQNELIKSLIKIKNEKNTFFLEMKDLRRYINKYAQVNNLILHTEKDQKKNKQISLNEEELNFSLTENEMYEMSQSEAENIFDLKKDLKYNELELLNKFINLYENHQKIYPQYKNLSNVCVNILIRTFKHKFSYLDYSTQKRKIIKEIIIALSAFLHKSLDNNHHKNLNEFSSDFSKIKNHAFNSMKNKASNEHLWEIYENNNDDEDHPFEDEDENHIFSRKRYEKNSFNKDDKVRMSDRLFGYFLYKTCVEDLSNFIINVWNVKEYEKIISMIEEFKSIFPNYLKEYLLLSIILPKLIEAVDDWNPQKDSVMIHIWIFPWLSLLKLENMDNLINKIQQKIEKSILEWNPNDLSVYTLISPWKNIFSNDYWENFFNRFIIPKLNFMISRIDINPKEQKLDSLKVLFLWADLIPISKICEILTQNFFPRFVEVFKLWLSQCPKIEEILKWYEGWKKVFSTKNIIEYSTDIQNIFKVILSLINRYLLDTK